MSLQAIPDFRVIEECDDWIVVDKPAPLIVHPANNKPEPTLLGGLEKLCAYEIENGACLGIITRLDRETSGLVLVAKHTAAARELGIILERREARKEYLAVVHGWPTEDEWTSEDRICRAADLGPSAIWVKQVVDESGKDCETFFRVTNRFERDGLPYSLVHCFPKTGRMHQIRVHLAAAGHPIAGDKLYSGDGSEYLEWMEHGWTEELAVRLPLSRVALHAYRLGLGWRGKEVAWEADLPVDLCDFVAGKPMVSPPGVVIWTKA